MKSYLLAVLCAVGLTGCVSSMFQSDPTPEQLASGCQIIKCICLEMRTGVLLPSLKKREVIEPLWRADGTAYCPEGHRLTRQGDRSVYDRPLY